MPPRTLALMNRIQCVCVKKSWPPGVIYLVLAAVIVPESLEYRKDSFLGVLV